MLCHTLAGVWIEASTIIPSVTRTVVTPSRVCGLKHLREIITSSNVSHTLAGVWIEAYMCLECYREELSHTLAGVWIEAFPIETL